MFTSAINIIIFFNIRKYDDITPVIFTPGWTGLPTINDTKI